MADTTTAAPLEPPRVYLVHMIVFTLVVAVLVAVLLPGMVNAFMANPFLNGVIIGTLLLGMFHSYRMVWRFFPEVDWVNRFRESDAESLRHAGTAIVSQSQSGRSANSLYIPFQSDPAADRAG